MTLPLEVQRRLLTHRVLVSHATTGQAIPSLRGELVGAPRSWVVGSVADLLVVSAPEGSTPDNPPAQIALSVADPAVALYLDIPDDELVVDLDTEDAIVAINPVPLTVEIVLTGAGGSPSAGQAVTIRSASNEVHAAIEVDPGRYQTDPHVFTPSFARFDVLVGADVIGEGVVDPYQLNTTIRLIDTT